MTHVTIYRNKENECIGFTVIGHAEYADAGEDIICAGISMLVINTCNAIEMLTTPKFSLTTNESEGLIDLRLKENPTKETELLLSAMILGFENMADDQDYKEYIHLTFEEV